MIIHDGLAYALGSMGHLHCFDAVTGEVRWRKDLNSEYGIEMPMWGISSSQLIEGDLLITQVGGTPDACLVAFDRRTGGEKWRALEDRASYSAPIVIDQAGKRVLVCWTGDNIVGLDAQSGEGCAGRIRPSPTSTYSHATMKRWSAPAWNGRAKIRAHG